MFTDKYYQVAQAKLNMSFTMTIVAAVDVTSCDVSLDSCSSLLFE